ncbi:MAG: YraN family protein [Bacteroidia bacterium]|nr:YraN family protein [Bacteroidia bacterium]
MAQHNITGQQGELLAQQYLLANGYVILHTNWRYRKYEVDIIAQKNNTLIFVEVKTRSGSINNVNEIITSTKQKQLVDALHNYCILHQVAVDAQIDLLIISNTSSIEHLQNALR